MNEVTDGETSAATDPVVDSVTESQSDKVSQEREADDIKSTSISEQIHRDNSEVKDSGVNDVTEISESDKMETDVAAIDDHDSRTDDTSIHKTDESDIIDKDEEVPDTETNDVENDVETIDMETESREEKDNEGGDVSEKKEGGDEEDDDDEGGEVEVLPAGLLERPYVLEKGVKRERKKVDRLVNTVTSPKEKKLVIEEGSGIKLSQCGYIDYQINKSNTEELKLMHKLLFHGPVKQHQIKKNVRQFCGFSFAKDDADYEKKLDTMGRYTLTGLVSVCDTLGLEKVGKKEAVMERLMDFLMKPHDHGKKVPEKRKKGEKKPATKRRSKSTPKGKKSKGGDDAEGEESAGESDDGGEGEKGEEGEGGADDTMNSEAAADNSINSEEDRESGVESDEVAPEEKSPKKTKKEPTKKKAAAKKTTPARKPRSAKDNSAKKSATKKTPEASKNKAAKRKAKATEAAEDDEDVSPEKRTKGPPSNEELKECIKKILDTADFEQVTMKTVIKDVGELYPEFDLTDRKAYMKTVVRQLIS